MSQVAAPGKQTGMEACPRQVCKARFGVHTCGSGGKMQEWAEGGARRPDSRHKGPPDPGEL